MKRIVFIVFIVFSPLIIFAQEKPNDAKEQGKDNGQQTTETMNKSQTGKDLDNMNKAADMKDSKMDQNMKKERFIDADGDGINDAHPGPDGANMPPKFKKKKFEHFSDKDGDGINDNRAKGMGWSGKGKEKGFGKH